MVGSPAYMSPEQIRSAKGTDARSDVWAMGVILYELVTGQNPFIGETIGDTLVKIASEPAPPVQSLAPEVPGPLASVIEACLVRDPAARTASIADLACELGPFAGRDASAFVARIVRVSASTRPFSVTPSDRRPPSPSPAPATPRRASPPQAGVVWPPAPVGRASAGRLGWKLALGLGAVAAIALGGWGMLVRGTARPRGVTHAQIASEIPAAQTSGAKDADAQPTSADAAMPEVMSLTPAASTLPANGGDSAAPRAADHRKTRRPPPPASSAEAPAAPPASSSHPPRSLDDLLEGRH